jgi:putative hydrolase of HD superfamily
LQNNRFKQQIEFIIEIDKLKQVFRQSILIDGTRRENDAEHSWHLAIMGILLGEYSQDDLDLWRVVKMVLIHDIVEIDAGDTYCYEGTPYADKLEREKKAADRLFNILPSDQREDFQRLWEEFEKRSTPEARFAAALDRLQPLLHNYKTKGESWKKHGVTSDQVIERNKSIIEVSKTLWDFAETIINDSIKKGYLPI